MEMHPGANLYRVHLRLVGMTDYYRDRVRHGGILANNFVKFWWENQVGPMQYGTEEKRPRRFGPGVMGPPVGESRVF